MSQYYLITYNLDNLNQEDSPPNKETIFLLKPENYKLSDVFNGYLSYNYQVIYERRYREWTNCDVVIKLLKIVLVSPQDVPSLLKYLELVEVSNEDINKSLNSITELEYDTSLDRCINKD